MHRALESEDIIYAVLEHVKSSATDLVNVAMTCSRLAGPALNMLWSEQSSLTPLIMCLPQDTWKVAEDQTINLSREPTLIEWERVRVNASRICRLILDDNSDAQYTLLPNRKPHASSRVLQKLFEQFPPALLFPKLCSLNYDIMGDLPELGSNFALLRAFFSPHLEVLLFDIPQGVPTHEVEQLVDALPVEAFGLRELAISARQGTSTFTVPPSLGKLPKLIVLDIDGIDVSLTRQTIINIQQARCLRFLVLNLHGTSYEDDANVRLEFNSLRQLCLSGDFLPQCTHFLRQLTTRQLSLIDIRYSKPACTTKIAEFMESLSMSCQTSEFLKVICIFDTSHTKQYNLKIPLSSEIFRPLLKFNRLLSVKFIGIGNYDLDDKFINDIAVAWPNIRGLKFASRRRGTCNVTFTAMMSLASRCRSLRALHLTFDAMQPTTIPRACDGTEELWTTQTALHKLHLGYSELSEVARVPYFLAEVFPTLSDFDWYRIFGDSDVDRLMESALAKAWQTLWGLRHLHDDYWDEGWEEYDSDNASDDWV